MDENNINNHKFIKVKIKFTEQERKQYRNASLWKKNQKYLPYKMHDDRADWEHSTIWMKKISQKFNLPVII